MNITLSVDEDVIRAARQRAEALGTSVNKLVRDYLKQIAGSSDARAEDELVRLFRTSTGNSHGWRFNRDEIYEER